MFNKVCNETNVGVFNKYDVHNYIALSVPSRLEVSVRFDLYRGSGRGGSDLARKPGAAAVGGGEGRRVVAVLEEPRKAVGTPPTFFCFWYRLCKALRGVFASSAHGGLSGKSGAAVRRSWSVAPPREACICLEHAHSMAPPRKHVATKG